MKIKYMTIQLATFAALCFVNVNIALAGSQPIAPPVPVSAPSFISLASVAVIIGIVAYKRKK